MAEQAEDQADRRLNNMTSQGLLVSSMTLLSRLSGLARDVVFAYLFGASQMADIFFVAFRIPNTFRRLFAEGAFSQAFVPVLMRYKAQGSGELQDFLRPLSGLFSVVLVAVVVLGVVGAPGLTALFAPGFSRDPELFQTTSELVRITFPYLGLISLTAYAGALLNAHGRFALPAVTPVLLNVCLLAAGGIAVAQWTSLPNIEVLAWGVVVAGITQLCLQIPFLLRQDLLPRPSLQVKHPGISQVRRLLGPALLSASVSQINAIVSTILASTLISGSIAWLYYADRLLELPIGLVAVALGTVMLPHLSAIASRNDPKHFGAVVDWGLKLGLGLSVPAAVGLYALAEPLVALIFASLPGTAMTAHDIQMAAAALQMFAFALPGFVLVKVLAPAFFAHQNTTTPLRAALAAIAVNILVSLSTIHVLGHIGLAMATAFSAWTQAIVLYLQLRRQGLYAASSGLVVAVLKMVAAGTVLAIFLIVGPLSPAFWNAQSVAARLLGLPTLIVGAVLAYTLLLLLLGLRSSDFRQEGAIMPPQKSATDKSQAE